MPRKITTISAEEFSGCESLKKFEIPNSVTTIGKDAFSDAGRVKTLVLPQSADVTLEKAGFFGKGVHDRKMWLKLRYAPIAYVCKN